mgnify:CR=1 FL=1
MNPIRILSFETVADAVAGLCGRAACDQPGDVLAMTGAGAYGMSMASNYNSRGRAAEVLVSGSRVWLIRRRETIEDLMALENTVPTDAFV